MKYELKQLTEDQVETALVQLAQKYKDQPVAPDAYFHLGEFYMNHQDYVRAQDAFQQLITNYPTSDEVGTAYFYAGRAICARGLHLGADAAGESSRCVAVQARCPALGGPGLPAATKFHAGADAL